MKKTVIIFCTQEMLMKIFYTTCAVLIFVFSSVLFCAMETKSYASPISSITSQYLGRAVNTFSDAVKALDSLVDVINKSFGSTVKMTSCISILKSKDELTSLSAKLARSAASDQYILIANIDEFLSNEQNREENWEKILGKSYDILYNVTELLDICKKINNRFVLESSYRNIQEALSGSGCIFYQLGRMPRPETNEEYAELKKVRDKYQELIKALNGAITKLNKYIKNSTSKCSKI
ncbi:MAG: hypothetical protein VB122_08535 [Erysipelotrichales bacterium]|nr:hypothetical protein [Erysipelotrichales bacterium]